MVTPTDTIGEIDQNELYRRQLGVLPPKDLFGQRVTLIGAGGINSVVALPLTKMGIPRLSAYDDDEVTLHNRPNQLYRPKDVGKPKVEALKDIVEEFSDCTIFQANKERYQEGAIPLRGIVVSGVDSMTSRKEIWKMVKGNPNVEFYIDGRMGLEVLTLFSLNPSDQEVVAKYEKTLFSDEEAFEAPCTERAIIYTPFAMASLISSQIKKFIKGEEIRWKIIFDLKNLILLVE